MLSRNFKSIFSYFSISLELLPSYLLPATSRVTRYCQFLSLRILRCKLGWFFLLLVWVWFSQTCPSVFQLLKLFRFCFRSHFLHPMGCRTKNNFFLNYDFSQILGGSEIGCLYLASFLCNLNLKILWPNYLLEQKKMMIFKLSHPKKPDNSSRHYFLGIGILVSVEYRV